MIPYLQCFECYILADFSEWVNLPEVGKLTEQPMGSQLMNNTAKSDSSGFITVESITLCYPPSLFLIETFTLMNFIFEQPITTSCTSASCRNSNKETLSLYQQSRRHYELQIKV